MNEPGWTSMDEFTNSFPAPSWTRIFPAAVGLVLVALPVFVFDLRPGFFLSLALFGFARWRLHVRLHHAWFVRMLTSLALAGGVVAVYGARPDGAIACFFAFFTLGMWSGGCEMIRVAIEGEAQRWTLREGAIEIDRRNLLGHGKTIIRAADLAEVSIRECPQDDGPELFSVRLRLHSGEAFETRGYTTREAAEKRRARLRSALGLD